MLRQNYLWMWQEKYEKASNISLPQQASLSSWANMTIFEASSHSSSQ